MFKILIFTKLNLQRYVKACNRVGLQAEFSDSLDNLDRFDGLLLPGGDDVEPSLYGQENKSSFNVDYQYDIDSIFAIKYFLSCNKPILGICKGLQIINVALGGTLLQDIKGHKAAEEVCKHKVRETCKNRLSTYYENEFFVNSIHHQAVDRLGEDLKVTYLADDGMIEGIEHTNKNLLAVQWHPERLQEGIEVFKAYRKMFDN